MLSHYYTVQLQVILFMNNQHTDITCLVTNTHFTSSSNYRLKKKKHEEQPH